MKRLFQLIIIMLLSFCFALSLMAKTNQEKNVKLSQYISKQKNIVKTRDFLLQFAQADTSGDITAPNASGMEKEEPKIPRKKMNSFTLDGMVNDKDTKLILFSAKLKHVIPFVFTHKLELNILSEYKETDEDHFYRNNISAEDEYSLGDNAIMFFFASIGNDQEKKKKLIATGLFGAGYDFLGNYGDDKCIKLSFGIGPNHEKNDDDTSNTSVINSLRLKIEHPINDIVTGGIVVWYYTSLYSDRSKEWFDLDDVNKSSVEGKLDIALEKIMNDKADLDLTMSVLYERDENPEEGVEKDATTAKIGIGIKY